jgi:hypothetical protein
MIERDPLRILSKQLADYLEYRAAQEGATYNYDAKAFYSALQAGERLFFGIACNNKRIVGDSAQPELFKEWEARLKAQSWMNRRK